MAVGSLVCGARPWRKVRGHVARLQEECADTARDLGLRDADRDDAHAPGQPVAGRCEQAALEAGERQGHDRPDRDAGRRAAVGGEPRGNVERHDGPPAGVHQLDRARDLAAGRAARAGAEERVDDDVRAPEDSGERLVVLESPGANAGGTQRLQIEPRVAADIVRSAREHDGWRGATALEPARDNESVTAVAALAADDDDARAAARRAERRECGGDGLGRAAAGVLHEGGAGKADLRERAAIQPPHLLGGEDAQHGGYGPGGSGKAWTRKSARIAVYVSRHSTRVAFGSSMCRACRGSLRIPARLAPVAA